MQRTFVWRSAMRAMRDGVSSVQPLATTRNLSASGNAGAYSSSVASMRLASLRAGMIMEYRTPNPSTRTYSRLARSAHSQT